MRTLKMNNTSITQSSRPDSSNLAPLTLKENSLPQRQFSKNWLLVPLVAMPIIVVVSGYFSSLHARQTSQPTVNTTPETLPTVASSSLELELTKAQQEALHKKYQATLEQLQAAQDQQVELQIAYQDLRDHTISLKRQNQQLQAFATEHSSLLAQNKQLQGTNGKLENQVYNYKQQSITLQNRLKVLESQKQQLTQENQQLQLATSELKALKPELEKAHSTIEQLSTQLNKKPDQMATINVNDKRFLVTQELADAIKTEGQQLKVLDNFPETEQHPQITSVK